MWIHQVNSFISGLQESIHAFSVPVIFDGHENRATNRLAVDHTIPLPGISPEEVQVNLCCLIMSNNNVDTIFVYVSMTISPDLITSPPSLWEGAQTSLAYQIVDKLHLVLKQHHPGKQPILFMPGNITQLDPKMKRIFIR